MRPSESPAEGQTRKLTDPFGNPIKPPMKVVGPLFLPWVREVIRDEEVAVIFLKEFWSTVWTSGWFSPGRRLAPVELAG